jgi:hypothetical protein
MPDDNTVMMEGVRLIFRNFTGREGKYNPPGKRNFGVVLPEDTAVAMEADGWPVKWLDPRDEEDEERTPWLPVKVAYDKGRPPKIYLVTERGPSLMREETVDQLDGVDITNVDLRVRPYPYEVRGETGISVYVQTMYVTIDEDPLDRKYAEMNHQ